MSALPPSIPKLVSQLLEIEDASAGSSCSDLDRAVKVCERLRVPITKLTGPVGFSSLLSRAVAIARRQAPSLLGLRVDAGGLLVSQNEIHTYAPLPVRDARGGSELLIGELIGLLITFIGEPLTLSLVREAWPDVSIETLTLIAEASIEKGKS